MNRLPCPKHGAFELHPLNADAWTIFQSYHSRLLRIQRDYGFKHQLVSPDFAAVETAIRAHGFDMQETFWRVIALLEHGLIPLMQ